jgi:outer membrane protein insertion porin family
MLLAVALVFVGNHAFSSAQLTGAMASGGQAFDPSVAVDSDDFQRALIGVENLYANHGYATVRIADPELSGDIVTVRIDEGPKYTVSTVTITGDYFGDPRTYLAAMSTRAGRLFSRYDVQYDDSYLIRHYENRGYAFANIVPFTHLDTVHGTISLEFQVDRGERAYYESIDVVAPTPEMADNIRRSLPIAVGDMYTSSAIDEMKRRADRVTGRDVGFTTGHGTTPTGVKVVLEVRPDQ